MTSLLVDDVGSEGSSQCPEAYQQPGLVGTDEHTGGLSIREVRFLLFFKQTLKRGGWCIMGVFVFFQTR